jgi:hypothetical protein
VLDSFFGYLQLITKTEKKSVSNHVKMWNDNNSFLGPPPWLEIDSLEMIHDAKAIGIDSKDIKALIGTLIDFWIESFEIVFSKSNIIYSPHLAICGMVISIMKMICTEFVEELDRSASLIVQHMQPHFPFARKFSCENDAALKVINTMNCEYCLVSLVLASEKMDKSFVEPVYEFVLQYFDTNTFSDHSIIALVVMNLFQNLHVSGKKKLLKKLIQFDERKNTRVTFDMVKNIVSENRKGDPEIIKSWILNLPKRLFGLKTTNISYSEQIIVFIGRFLSKIRVGEEQVYVIYI